MNVPIAPPPLGRHSDFEAPAQGAKTFWVLILLSVTIAFVAVTIRLYVKRFVARQRFSWDDGKHLSHLP